MSWVAVALIGAGGFFLSVSSIGLLRLPDFYSRAHAAGKSETLGAILVLSGIVVHHGLDDTGAKLLLTLLLVAGTNPAAIHVLARAAVRSGLQVWGVGEEHEPVPERDPGHAAGGRGERPRGPRAGDAR